MNVHKTKPEGIAALQWDGTPAGAIAIIGEVLQRGGTARYICSNRARCEEFDGDTPHAIEIGTPGGMALATLGDWVSFQATGDPQGAPA